MARLKNFGGLSFHPAIRATITEFSYCLPKRPGSGRSSPPADSSSSFYWLTMTDTNTQELAKSFDPAAIEARWYPIWEERGYFKAGLDPKKPSFSFHVRSSNMAQSSRMKRASPRRQASRSLGRPAS